MSYGKLPGPPPTCPHCQGVIDGYTGQADFTPGTGDFAMCSGCGRLGVYLVNAITGFVTLRLPTPVELALAEGDPEVQAAAKFIMSRRPPPTSSMEKLPCGCAMGTVGEAFVFQPHALDCQYYLYVMEQMRAQGKDVLHIADPGMS